LRDVMTVAPPLGGFGSSSTRPANIAAPPKRG
jgi:hypothetical protein